MKAPGNDIMNTLTRSVLTLSAYDPDALDTSLPNVLRQSLMLIATTPMMSAYGYHAYNHYCQDGSFYIHNPDESLTMAENLLMMLQTGSAVYGAGGSSTGSGCWCCIWSTAAATTRRLPPMW